MNSQASEVSRRQRFEFGANWANFLRVLDEDRVREAENSLAGALGVEDLAAKRFLDVGSGSGLFSMAARRLGAEVRSFDFDPQSVSCTRELKRRYFPDESGWIIEEGSVLDTAYLARLGRFDVVYSWGVLHHTGDMWRALANVVPLVEQGGWLFISIYNDQGWPSRQWRRLKRIYNRYRLLRLPLAVFTLFHQWTWKTLMDVVYRRPLSWREYKRSRGMSAWHDVVDWIGGYPFEVAKPEEIFDFYRQRGFRLERLTTRGGGHGCNEFVFRRIPPSSASPE